MGRYLKLAKNTLLRQSHRTRIEPKPDLYAARMRRALTEINSPDYPAGMILWLDKAHPQLYTELTSRIPREIDGLWNESAPVGEFQAVLDRLVDVHRECCRLYRESSVAASVPVDAL